MRSSYPITQRIMRRVVRPIGLTAMDSVLDPADVHAAAFVEENELFAALAASADLATPVPTCPEWTLKQLFRHVGRGDRWAATIVRTGEPIRGRWPTVVRRRAGSSSGCAAAPARCSTP
jgi:mycothiol maleylpyruvate isomerase-like protein